MKKHVFLVSLLTLAAVLAVPSTVLAASQITHVQGDSANASFWGFDPTGCIVTGADLFVTENRVQSQGAPTATQWLYVSVYQWNECGYDYSYTLTASGSGPIPADAFQGSLSSATLHVTVPVYNWLAGSNSELTLDLAWNGTGDTSPSTTSESYSYPGYRFRSRYNGSSRSADVAGSIHIDSTDLTPLLTSSYGSLSRVRAGSVSISQPDHSAGQ